MTKISSPVAPRRRQSLRPELAACFICRPERDRTRSLPRPAGVLAELALGVGRD